MTENHTEEAARAQVYGAERDAAMKDRSLHDEEGPKPVVGSNRDSEDGYVFRGEDVVSIVAGGVSPWRYHARRILAIFRKPPPAPVKWIYPRPWTVTGRRLVGMHINNMSRGAMS